MIENLIQEISEFEVTLSFIGSILTVLSSSFLGGIIGAKITSKSDQRIANKTLRDSLDSKSGWREKLFQVASSSKIGLREVYVVRTALRYRESYGSIDLFTKTAKEYLKVEFDGERNDLEDLTKLYYKKLEQGESVKSNTFSKEVQLPDNVCTFENMTTTIIRFCDRIINEHEESEKRFKLTKIEQKKTRIYTRYLLKHHWQWLSLDDGGKNDSKEKRKVIDKEAEWINDTMNLIYKTENSIFIG